MLPLPAAPQPTRAKRRQVKNACTNCQKACKKCDDARPCLRCVKYGMQEACISSQRKERKKGVKRGPYKKRESKGPPLSLSPPLPAYYLLRTPVCAPRCPSATPPPCPAHSAPRLAPAPSPIHVHWPSPCLLSPPPPLKDRRSSATIPALPLCPAPARASVP